MAEKKPDKRFGGQVYNFNSTRTVRTGEHEKRLPYEFRVTLTQLHAAGAHNPYNAKTVEQILYSIKNLQSETTLTLEDLEQNINKIISLQGTIGHEEKVYVHSRINRGLRYWLGKDSKILMSPSSHFESGYFTPKRTIVHKMYKENRVPRNLGEI